jgi:hypothetical protein
MIPGFGSFFWELGWDGIRGSLVYTAVLLDRYLSSVDGFLALAIMIYDGTQGVRSQRLRMSMATV